MTKLKTEIFASILFGVCVFLIGGELFGNELIGVILALVLGILIAVVWHKSETNQKNRKKQSSPYEPLKSDTYYEDTELISILQTIEQKKRSSKKKKRIVVRIIIAITSLVLVVLWFRKKSSS